VFWLLDERSLRLLEFRAVQERLASRCDTTLGQAAALDLLPQSDAAQVRWRLLRTGEARRLLERVGGLPLGGVRDLGPHLRRALLGGTLTVEELGEVEQSLSAMRRSRQQLLAGREDWPTLWEDGQLLAEIPDLEQALQRSLGPDGLRDEASPELARLRRARREKEQALRQRLEALLRTPDLSRYLQEPLITLRSGRLCVPVLREHQQRIPGVVHDASQTGQTLFIEPLFALEMGNEAHALARQAEQEEERILAAFSAQVAANGLAIEAGMAATAALDLALGLGRLAFEMNAVEPELTAEGRLRLRRARHPLLHEPVPIDLEMGPGRRLLVVTGPNTGGKTVSLKTAGLLQAMAQCGMHLPAQQGTTVPVLRDILCDIGDEQSIEQSLSTFSSHMTAIVDICRRLGPDVLVLLDEIGAGTDPQEGAALAQAILERIAGSGALGLVTTHYGELKAFAYATDDVENASMAFNPETLQPSYRLQQGAPGSSYAFVIAGRLGLEQDIVGRAKELLGKEQLQLTEVLQRVDSLRRRLEQELAAAEEAARAAQAAASRSEELRREAEAERRTARQQLRVRLDEEVQAARRSLRAARDALRQEELQQRREGALAEARKRIEDVEARLQDEEPPAAAPGPAPEGLRPGDRVFVPQVGQEGGVLSAPDESGRVWVAVGSLRLQAAMQDLRLAKGKKQQAKGGTGWAALAQQKAQTVQSEITLIGMRAEEALLVLDRYLDDAQVAGLGTVRVIHGKGTGALRSAVHAFLQGDRRVKGHRLGAQGEGGVGATVVELDT